MRVVLGLVAALLTAGAALAKPPAAVYDHKDWIGVCDNTRRCTVMGFPPDGGDRAFLSISRDGDPAAAPVLTALIYTDARPAAAPIRLQAPTLDAALPGAAADDHLSGTSRDPGVIAAVARVAAGKAQALTMSAGKTTISLPLDGAAGALVWMDDRQGRIGSVSALTRKGPKPVAALAPAPAVPVYAAAPKGSASEIKRPVFPKGLLARAELKDCDKDEAAKMDERGAWRLGPDLILWSVPCTMGAYNLDTVFFVTDGRGGAIRPAPFSTIPGLQPDQPASLFNADFDPKTMELSAFEKGRGLGDCGDSVRYLWTGRGFAPLEVAYMPECRGVVAESWPLLYRGRRR